MPLGDEAAAPRHHDGPAPAVGSKDFAEQAYLLGRMPVRILRMGLQLLGPHDPVERAKDVKVCNPVFGCAHKKAGLVGSPATGILPSKRFLPGGGVPIKHGGYLAVGQSSRQNSTSRHFSPGQVFIGPSAG